MGSILGVWRCGGQVCGYDLLPPRASIVPFPVTGAEWVSQTLYRGPVSSQVGEIWSKRGMVYHLTGRHPGRRGVGGVRTERRSARGEDRAERGQSEVSFGPESARG